MRILVVFILLFLPAVALAGVFDETRQLELSVEGVQAMKIECEAGFLTVIGVKAIDRISATAEIRVRGIQEDEFQHYLKKQLLMALEKRGNTAVL